MYQITKRVATLYAVYDYTDGVVDWITADMAEGLDLNDIKPVEVGVSGCNFRGRNIFEHGKLLKTRDGLEVTCDGKKYKGRFLGDWFEFNNGVRVATQEVTDYVKSHTAFDF